ncbi:hypothetical protein HQQ81_14575 [Microbacteriaceae bacterium VKM Ac-2854]|nr:hypothetical protein [Microbacteriaceae bacterium VKM Ac-2854]
MTRLASVLSAADLPLAELSAARLDGELFPLDECYTLSDLPVGRDERGQVLTAILPGHAVANHDSAAWVHGAIDEPPSVHSFAVDIAARTYTPPSIRYRMHEVVLPTRDITRIGGSALTTPLRTLGDLARTRTSWSGDDEAVLRKLADMAEADEGRILRYLTASARLPGKQRARQRIRAAFSPR